MKRIKQILLLGFISISGLLKGAEMRAFLNYSVFYIPEQGPYLETYLSVIGNSIKYVKNDKQKFQGRVEISILFRQNEEIKAAKKYNLLSPELEDTTIRSNFIDQQRFVLANGTYEMEISVRDQNKEDKAYSIKQTVQIDLPEDKVSISDIQLLESFKKSDIQNVLSKSGYDLVPYISNFYTENLNKLSFYAEVYNTKKIVGIDEKILINYYVESYDNHTTMTNFSGFSKQTTSNVNSLLNEFNITELPSGNYNLVIDVKNKSNQLLTSKKTFFQRKAMGVSYKLEDIAAINVSNTFVDRINDIDSLKEYIRSVRPISTESEKLFAENQVKTKDITAMKQYLFSFWLKRNEKTPQLAFINYNKEVARVNKSFGTQTRKGYDTERGRVYLQYGPPDHRTEAPNEPNSYPYEIWQYYKTNGQSNRKFIFYSPDLVSNNYLLLYSDAIGETSDPNWRMTLQKRTMQSINPDQQKGAGNYGGNADEIFLNPR